MIFTLKNTKFKFHNKFNHNIIYLDNINKNKLESFLNSS